MKGGTALVIVIASLLVITPTGIAPPSGGGPSNGNGNASNANEGGGNAPAPNSGLEHACEVASSTQPCEHLGLLDDLDVQTGESDTYSNGTWTVEGTITVHTGGVLTLDNATFRFTGQSGGILVNTGGVLRIYDSVLEPREGDATEYVLDLQPDSSFTLNETTVRGGHGVKLRTDDADVSGNLLTEIPLALHMIDVVEVTIHHNHFLDNNVSVNQTGGVTTLDANFFEGGDTCVRDWLADPTITNNVFRGCHTGIWHERSNSRFELNDMEDQAAPPGTGIVVMDTNSPIIENNLIRNYGTGILVQNATAYIRNNTIANNVGDGVRVVANTQRMDLTGNLIEANGGDGVHLIAVEDVFLENNTIVGNGGHGVNAESAWGGVSLTNDMATYNGGHGFLLQSGIVNATGILAKNNTQHGVRFAGNGTFTLLSPNASSNGGDGFRVDTASDATVDLLAPTAIGNTGAGLHALDGTTADNGWWEDNGGPGVRNADPNPDAIVPSECSYWGSPTGPTHEFNEGGTGDEVEGNVDYAPYRTTPSPPTCVATEIYYAYDG